MCSLDRLAGSEQHESVLVMAQSRAGEWTLWRVGRHRLAWRPARRGGLNPYQLYGVHPDAGAEMLSWVGSLLATIVVLPWRIASNRWPPPPDEPPSG